MQVPVQEPLEIYFSGTDCESRECRDKGNLVKENLDKNEVIHGSS